MNLKIKNWKNYLINLGIIEKFFSLKYIINPLASPSAGAPALKYGDVNTVTPSPGEVKELKILNYIY